MSKQTKNTSIMQEVKYILEQDYRGVKITIYTIASLGLAAAIYHVRPVSKFSKASKIPMHFIQRHEPLKGKFVGVDHQSPVRLLVDHHAPIYLPLWHSRKPPLPVKLWGVDIVSGNAISWLQCVAAGQRVTIKPIAKDNDNLVSAVDLHLPIRPKSKGIETLDIGRTLVELGLARVAISQSNLEKKSIEAKLASALISAESKAKSQRLGVWSEILPPLPIYVQLWRKFLRASSKATLTLSKRALIGVKNMLTRKKPALVLQDKKN